MKKDKVRNRQGRCYELAGRFIFRLATRPEFALAHGDDWELVHGEAWGVRHAWCGRAGIAWEPVHDFERQTADFYKAGKVKVARRYTTAEVVALGAKTAHWGPWTAEEAAEDKKPFRSV